MSNSAVLDDESLIDTNEIYTDGDLLRWHIISVNVNERTVTIRCQGVPLRTIPLSDLEKMERGLLGSSDGVPAGAVISGFAGIYTDQDKLSWQVQAVNLRDRTVTVELLNPPRRTISVEQLQKMKPTKREARKR